MFLFKNEKERKKIQKQKVLSFFSLKACPLLSTFWKNQLKLKTPLTPRQRTSSSLHPQTPRSARLLFCPPSGLAPHSLETYFSRPRTRSTCTSLWTPSTTWCTVWKTPLDYSWSTVRHGKPCNDCDGPYSIDIHVYKTVYFIVMSLRKSIDLSARNHNNNEIAFFSKKPRSCS